MNRSKKELSRRDFLSLLERIFEDSIQAPPERYSTDWFFMRYIRRLLKLFRSSNQPKDLESTIRGMTRFYIDVEKPSATLSEQFESVRSGYTLLRRIHQTTDAQTN